MQFDKNEKLPQIGHSFFFKKKIPDMDSVVCNERSANTNTKLKLNYLF